MRQGAQEKAESIDELVARVRPLMDAVDLDSLSDRLQASIAIGELSGRETADWMKQLLALKSDGVITAEEFRAVGIKLSDGE